MYPRFCKISRSKKNMPSPGFQSSGGVSHAFSGRTGSAAGYPGDGVAWEEVSGGGITGVTNLAGVGSGGNGIM